MTEPKLIPEQFTAQSNAFASYNYTDIAEGTGVTKFYGFSHEESTGKRYSLSSEAVISRDRYFNDTSASVGKDMDLDFDISFHKQKTVNGVLRVVGSVYVGAPGGNAKVRVRVRKWDGTTETEIVYADSQTMAGSDVYHPFTMEMTVPQTHFQSGESLRITVEFWNLNASTTFPMKFYYDTLNTLDSATQLTSQFLVFVPFRLDEIGA